MRRKEENEWVGEHKNERKAPTRAQTVRELVGELVHVYVSPWTHNYPFAA